ncbi:Cof-type HAD-IIB family hydrolase [Facklamia languida]|uniref:Cof-like hydrolase n=1 Tax=Facklamia languida CCUG 37842 TaxID=883113 RepID=H3NIP0_9LACT|nr:Cof-type HAD-IIB family hydrolase [Facklamia languida]EHR37168.1 cof-like hydrolase [Facklamia languida CCUG 37842]
MIKLFASDLDGTLLGKDHQITPGNAQAVHDLQASGIDFIVATGRDLYSCRKLLAAANIQCDVIVLNGAAIYNRDDQLIFQQGLDVAVTQALVKDLNQRQLDYSIMGATHFYVRNIQDFYNRLMTTLHEDPQAETTNAQLRDQFGMVKSLDDYSLDQDPPFKLMVMSKQAAALEAFKAEWQDEASLDITSSGPDNLEITHHLAQKGLAIQRYLQNKDYGLDQVASIGDSLNDRSMLQMTGYSYAMSNASSAVKQLAKDLAAPHDEDGVAQVIQMILSNR